MLLGRLRRAQNRFIDFDVGEVLVARFVVVVFEEAPKRLLGQNAFLVEELQDLLHAISLALLAGIEDEIGRRRRLVNAVDAGEAVQLARARLFVELCNF